MVDTPEVVEGVPGFQPASGESRPKRKAKRDEPTMGLNINSMMDIFTIILVFLLKSYSADPVKITPGDDLKVPISNAMLAPSEAVPVAITKSKILVNDQLVADVSDGKVDVSKKQGGEKGYLITPVFDALSAEAEKQRTIAKYNSSQSFKGLAILIADEATPYRLLTEVLYSAGQAQFANFKFAVVKGD